MEKWESYFNGFKPIMPRNDKGEIYDPSIQLYAPNCFGTYVRITDTIGDQLFEDGKYIDHMNGCVYKQIPEWRGLTKKEIKEINDNVL